MHIESNIIAKKYAFAFLNLFSDTISVKNIENWTSLERFLKKNRLFYIYLRIPSISSKIKVQALEKLVEAFDLGKPIIKLIFLLLEKGRIEILDKVLNKIVFYYRKLNKINLFKVISSHDLSDLDKKKIIYFIKDKTKEKEVITEFEKDENLICGLRIQSDNFLWERSIAKQLRDVKRSIFKQVGLW